MGDAALNAACADAIKGVMDVFEMNGALANKVFIDEMRQMRQETANERYVCERTLERLMAWRERVRGEWGRVDAENRKGYVLIAVDGVISRMHLLVGGRMRELLAAMRKLVETFE